jgi:prepilin-type N-terminal cleavage/methylation domain-containing protein
VSRGQRAGFTMIELLVTVVVLCVLLTGAATLMTRTYRGSTQSTASTYRTAELLSEASRLGALPYGYLTAGTTCDTVGGFTFPRIRCSTVTFLTSEMRQIRVVVTPTRNTLLAPDTLVFERGR